MHLASLIRKHYILVSSYVSHGFSYAIFIPRILYPHPSTGRFFDSIGRVIRMKTGKA